MRTHTGRVTTRDNTAQGCWRHKRRAVFAAAVCLGLLCSLPGHAQDAESPQAADVSDNDLTTAAEEELPFEEDAPEQATPPEPLAAEAASGDVVAMPPPTDRETRTALPPPGEDEIAERVDSGARGADTLAESDSLVKFNFPDPTDIKDIIKAVSTWYNKNFILDKGIAGTIQIIAPREVTKEEAYQAFLSALSMNGLTTLETGKVVKIIKIDDARRDSVRAFSGRAWAPRTDAVITQVIPLRYITAKDIQQSLVKFANAQSLTIYEPTNTLIVTDTGYRVNKILEIVDLLDVQAEQPKVAIVPIKYADPKNIADRINEILDQGSPAARARSSGSSYNSFKILVDDRSNSVIIFGPPRTIDDVKALVAKFDYRVNDPAAEASIHVRPLDYADAKQLATTISALTQASASKSLRAPPLMRPDSSTSARPGATGSASVAELADGVKITADEASNSLLITGKKTAYDALNAIIRKLDIRGSQVFIEVEILDINVSGGSQFGTSIFAGWQDGVKGVAGWEAAKMAPLVVSDSTVNAGGSITADNATRILDSFSTQMTIGILAGSSIDVPGLGKFTPGALINAIKNDGNSRSLASPSILTNNNQEAEIRVGERVFVSVARSGADGKAVQDLKPEDVQTALIVKPNVSHSNYVTLKVEIDANALVGVAENGTPRISTRKSKQLVTVKDGQTIVISGLLRQSEHERWSGIPLLSDIPLLGWLFRNSASQKEKSHLMVFMTPHIVHGGADLEAVYQKALRDRDHHLEGVYGENFRDDTFYRRLVTPENGKYKASKYDEAEEKLREERQQEALRAMRQDPLPPGSGSLIPAGDVSVPMPQRSDDDAPQEPASEKLSSDNELTDS